MSEPSRRAVWFRRLAVIPPVLIGVGAMALAVGGREPPKQTFTERATVVRTISVQKLAFTPRATGYGTVTPGREWKAVAQVDGRVTEKHTRLKSGEIIAEGAVLLRIDPTDYKLALAQAEANLRGAEAEIAELDARRGNLKSSIVIEKRTVALGDRDLERKQRLRKRGNVSDVQLDRAQLDVLASRQRLQELENTLNLIPAQRGVLNAKLAQYRALLEVAGLDLTRTDVTAPFALRVGPVNVEAAQFVRRGEVLAEGSGIEVAEIAAQFPVDRVLPLIPAELDPSSITPETLSTIQHQLGFSAVVRLRSGRLETEWKARFSRIGDTIDPRTRTVGVIVAVDQPYRKARPGQRPALIKGMFVEVELRGRDKPQTLVAPRAAIHAGDDGAEIVYVVDGRDRLRRRKVAVGLEQADFVTITAGLKEGERIVVTDPVPAIDGMLLDVVRDGQAEARLRNQASGGK